MCNRLFSLMVCLCVALSAASQQTEDTLVLFEKKQVVYLLADSVNIRKEPSTESALVAKLPIGTRLTILNKSKTASRINNILMPWYLVAINEKETGYVWGGKIALASFRSNKNPDIVFHFGMEKIENGNSVYQIRVQQLGKELQRLSFQGFKGYLKRHTCTNISNKGLSSVDDILQVDGFAESCGEDAGSIVFFWANNKLSLVERLTDMADGGFFDRAYLVYPADMEGKKDQVIKREEAGEILFDENQHVASWYSTNVKYEKNLSTAYIWNGSKLVKAN